jgi:hypothetical protein
MPAVSRAQQRALYAKKGSAWVHRHHFDTIDPAARRRKKPKRDPRGEVDAIIRRLKGG